MKKPFYVYWVEEHLAQVVASSREEALEMAREIEPQDTVAEVTSITIKEVQNEERTL